MDDREKKLPRWVQDELRDLRVEVRRLSETLRALTGEQKTGVAFARGLDQNRYLPDHTRVSFELPIKGYKKPIFIDCMALVRDGRILLEVTGDTAIKVLPRSSNQIWVEFSEADQP